MIGTVVGKYRITQEIGDGGHAFVFKGEGEGDVVAIKMLKPSAIDDDNLEKRFLLEAESLKKLKHPAIVGFKDYRYLNGYHYLVLEFMDQGSVDNLFHTNGPLEPKYALPIFFNVLGAISYAHDQGIIHRDMKPNNVLINSKGEAKLSDFGIAKVVGAGHNLTRKGYALGTMGYMAPELISQGVVSVMTDIYALGVTLYEMLTTRKPFEFENENESPLNFARRVCQGKPTLPSTYRPTPPELEKIVMKAIAQNPKDRYQTAKDLAKDLKKHFPELVSRPIAIQGRAMTRFVNVEDISRGLKAEPLAQGGESQLAKLRWGIIALDVAAVGAATFFAPKFFPNADPKIIYGAGGALTLASAGLLHFLLPKAAEMSPFGAQQTPQSEAALEPDEAPMQGRGAPEPEIDEEPGDTIPFHEGMLSSTPFKMTDESELNAFLVVLTGPDKGKRFGLRPVSRIGRDLRLDIRPHDPEISRHHAVLTFDGQGFTAEDLGSTNGTFVNEEKVVGRRRLRPGDILRVGSSSMKFEFQGKS